MSKQERRSARRLIMRVPLRFRPVKTPSLPERVASSLNISTHGVYFATDQKLSEGVLVHVSLKMPREVAGNEEKEWRFTGRIAHVEPLGAANGTSGVGVQFIYYEAPAFQSS